MKSLCAVFLGAALFLCPPSAFSVELGEGSVSFASEYVFRGVSQSDEEVAVQGALSFNVGNAHLQIWGSSVDFAAGAGEQFLVDSTTTLVSVYTGPSTEIDIILGFEFESGGINMDTGVIFYQYPGGEADEDYVELYLRAGEGPWSVGINYSSDYFGGNDDFVYIYGSYEAALAANVMWSAHVGWNIFDNEQRFDSFFGSSTNSDEDYLDWSLSVSRQVYGLDMALQYIGTNIDSDVCEEWCEDRMVFSVGKSF